MTLIARGLCRLRWLVLAAWVAGAVLATTCLPTIEQANTGAVGAMVPQDADAIKAEKISKTQFGFPLLSRTLLVEHRADGLSLEEQAGAVRLAAALTRHAVPGFRDVAAALPVSNAVGGAPFARQRSTTVVTYLFFRPDVGISRRVEAAQGLAEHHVHVREPAVVGVTGQVPALRAQQQLIIGRLPLIELATVLLVALAVGLRFQALGAPALTLGAVAIAYLVSSRVVALVGEKLDVAVPQEVEPILVVLLFGVVTDYSIFYLERFRALLAEGADRRQAAVAATAQLTPIVAAAGITVIAATVTLLAAHLQFLRVFGPGLAFAVLVGLVVALTFVPACLAIFGRALYWPRRPAVELSAQEAAEETPTERVGRPRRSRAVRFACRRPWVTIAACGLLLAACCAGLLRLHLANPAIRGLPSGSEPRQAYEAAARGFAPGILSPTVLVVSAPGITSRRGALARLQRLLARQRGVALVLGPGQQPVPGVRFGATLSGTGDAARYFVVLREDPLGARAIEDLRRMRSRLPRLLERAGIAGVDAMFAGDTALTAETIDKTIADLGRIAPLTLAAIFLVLAIFLRALVAPLYLVAASALTFAAALGIGALIFGELTYYVPFASAVLLVSLGSDYNVFLIGRIWQEAAVRPLHEAVPVASARAAKAITVAGLVLAGSFALIALIPVRAFTELAVIMAIGLLLDALVIRTVLVPALVTVFGRASGWPGRRLHGPASEPVPAAR
ncbi:MAG TPA: MMPL family transporter [Baekduia sp.]|nr:MMPL family transporter [Baekduia sp.]